MDNLQYRTQDAYLSPHSCTRLFCNFDTLQYRDRTSLDARQLLLYNKPCFVLLTNKLLVIRGDKFEELLSRLDDCDDFL